MPEQPGFVPVCCLCAIRFGKGISYEAVLGGCVYHLGIVWRLFSNIGLLVVTVVIAFAGKILGCVITKPFSRLTLKQLYYAGWAMNSRGAAELVIALAAKQLGLIPLEVFSALVAMSLITTLAFPPVLARGIHRNPGLMTLATAGDVEI